MTSFSFIMPYQFKEPIRALSTHVSCNPLTLVFFLIFFGGCTSDSPQLLNFNPLKNIQIKITFIHIRDLQLYCRDEQFRSISIAMYYRTFYSDLTFSSMHVSFYSFDPISCGLIQVHHQSNFILIQTRYDYV